MPIAGSISSEIAIPAGHELTKIAIAVAISLPANQSVIILVIRTLSSTPPAACDQPPRHLPSPVLRRRHRKLAQQHQRERADRPSRLSPNFWPIAPPGNASAMPGVK